MTEANTRRQLKILGCDTELVEAQDFRLITAAYLDNAVSFSDAPAGAGSSRPAESAYNFLCLPLLISKEGAELSASPTADHEFEIRFL